MAGAGVETSSACDADAHCRKVLASLCGGYAPKHVGGSLQARMSIWLVKQAEDTRKRVVDEFNGQLTLSPLP